MDFANVKGMYSGTYDKIQEGCGIFFPVSKEKYENVASNVNRWKISNQMGVKEVKSDVPGY